MGSLHSQPNRRINEPEKGSWQRLEQSGQPYLPLSRSSIMLIDA